MDRSWRPTYSDIGRMVTLLANEELLTEIAKMIVDGTVLAPSLVRPLFIRAQARLNRSLIRYTSSTMCTAHTIS